MWLLYQVALFAGYQEASHTVTLQVVASLSKRLLFASCSDKQGKRCPFTRMRPKGSKHLLQRDADLTLTECPGVPFSPGKSGWQQRGMGEWGAKLPAQIWVSSDDQWSSPVDLLEMAGAAFLDPADMCFTFPVAGSLFLLWLKREVGENVN